MSHIITRDEKGNVIRKRKSRQGADWDRIKRAKEEHEALEEIRRVLGALDKRAGKTPKAA
jgi:hypothetical protein